MREIASKIGMRAQDAVSRLLSLKPLRTDVRHQMLTQLKVTVFTQAMQFVSPDQLRHCDRLNEALTLSQRVADPGKQWAVYLNALALVGFRQWLATHSLNFSLDETQSELFPPLLSRL